jgi:histidine ammonia-lyase
MRHVKRDGFVIPPEAGLRCLRVRCTCLACIALAGAEQALFSTVIAVYLKYAASHGIRDALNLNLLLVHHFDDFLRIHQKIDELKLFLTSKIVDI